MFLSIWRFCSGVTVNDPFWTMSAIGRFGAAALTRHSVTSRLWVKRRWLWLVEHLRWRLIWKYRRWLRIWRYVDALSKTPAISFCFAISSDSSWAFAVDRGICRFSMTQAWNFFSASLIMSSLSFDTSRACGLGFWFTPVVFILRVIANL